LKRERPVRGGGPTQTLKKKTMILRLGGGSEGGGLTRGSAPLQEIYNCLTTP